jgi:hypothetical protein
MLGYCSTKQNAKYRKCVMGSVRERVYHHHGSIMPEDAQVVRQYIIDKLKAEEKRTSPGARS